MISVLNKKTKEYLKHLCVDITDRSPGTPGNKEATAFFEMLHRLNRYLDSLGLSLLFKKMDHESFNIRISKSLSPFLGAKSKPLPWGWVLYYLCRTFSHPQ